MATTRRRYVCLWLTTSNVNADTLAIIFRNSGLYVKSVYSGYSAIDTAVDFQPDVVISEIVMPSLGGVETILSISRQCRNQ